MAGGSAKYVVLGGGMVAGYAAKEFAERDANDVLIVSSDAVPPYERPPLSKGFLAGKDDEASVFINPEQWYRDHGMEVRLRTVVQRVDARRKLLRTRDGDEISFEKLLVATGARARVLDVPAATLPGVCYLRSLDDSVRCATRAYWSSGRASSAWRPRRCSRSAGFGRRWCFPKTACGRASSRPRCPRFSRRTTNAMG